MVIINFVPSYAVTTFFARTYEHTGLTHPIQTTLMLLTATELWLWFCVKICADGKTVAKTGKVKDSR